MAGVHEDGRVPRDVVRMPVLKSFELNPQAREGGGIEKCNKSIHLVH